MKIFGHEVMQIGNNAMKKNMFINLLLRFFFKRLRLIVGLQDKIWGPLLGPNLERSIRPYAKMALVMVMKEQF